MAAVQCAKYEACGYDYFLDGALAGECERRVAAACVAETTAPQTGWTPSAIDACNAAVPNLACSALDASACTFTGTLALGSPCAFDGQCASGSCSASSLQCGSCQPPRPPPSKAVVLLEAGAECDRSDVASRCHPFKGLFCDATTNTCAKVTPVPLGGACDASAGLVCQPKGRCAGPAGARTCIANVEFGGACTTTQECGFALCVGGTCRFPEYGDTCP